MKFTDIIGHEKPVRTLQQAIRNETLAHAFLFSGYEGIGKKLTALALAAAVNCPNASADGGCGVCSSCRRVAGGTHPDVHLLLPDGDEIKIDQIRRAQADLALKPFEGERKTMIVDGADRMNTAAANAFLKTLEEPPGDTLLVLIAALPQGLLPTIRSRCQEIKFQPLARRTLALTLEAKRGLSEDDALFIAALAQGSLGRALAMDLEKEKAARGLVMELWSGLPALGPAQALSLAEGYGRDREGFLQLLDIGSECLRDAVVYGETGDRALLVNAQGEERYREWNRKVSLPRMLADLDLLARSRTLLDRRVSAQLVAENLLLALSRA
jgi:DNA polymerase III subunit delta'